MTVRRSIETLLKPSQFQVIHLNILRGEVDATEEPSVLSKSEIEEDDATEDGSVLSGHTSLNSVQCHCQECHSDQDGQGWSQIRSGVHLKLWSQDHQFWGVQDGR